MIIERGPARAGFRARWMLIWAGAMMALAPAHAGANVFDDISRDVSRAFDYVIPDAWQEEQVRLAIGAGALSVPDYEGSNDYKMQPLPVVDLRLGDRILLQTNQVKLVAGNQPVRYGAIARLDLGRSADANPALAGLEGVGTAMEVGGFAEGRLNGWVMQMELRQDILSGHKGAIATLAFGRFEEIGDKWRIIAGTRVNWASNDYMDSFFGVTPEEAAASVHPAYDAGSGFKDIGLRVIGSYRASENVTVQGGVGYQRLLGEANDSPIVSDAGSPHQVTAGITVRYSIWRRN